jgi:hypothetical protein
MTVGEPNILRRAMPKPSKDFDSAQGWKALFPHWKQHTPFCLRFVVARDLPPDDTIIVNVSGRGDKDVSS